jgi:hypothetical protein
LSQYWALVIGINDYPYFKKLKTAVSDAEGIAGELRDEYGAKTQLVLNASREQILTALNYYRDNLDEDSNSQYEKKELSV